MVDVFTKSEQKELREKYPSVAKRWKKKLSKGYVSEMIGSFGQDYVYRKFLGPEYDKMYRILKKLPPKGQARKQPAVQRKPKQRKPKRVTQRRKTQGVATRQGKVGVYSSTYKRINGTPVYRGPQKGLFRKSNRQKRYIPRQLRRKIRYDKS